MKRLLFVVALSVVFSNSWSISPFYKLAEKETPLLEIEKTITEALNAANYEILGSYNTANNENFKVIVFTNTKLKEIALSYPDRGALAAAQKVGLMYKNGKTTVSLLNPTYIFHAYFQEDFEQKKNDLMSETKAIKKVFSDMGFSFTPFGGDLSEKDLHDYQYMMGMPEFTDPVKLNSYDNFEAGLKTIRKNLAAKTGNTTKVYELVFPEKKIAVFGIGLLDPEEGEKKFLSIIGEDHLAAMPYEIILHDNKVTMLHGRFRFALYWPELTMGTFTKIMSTPGDVEDFMEAITK